MSRYGEFRSAARFAFSASSKRTAKILAWLVLIVMIFPLQAGLCSALGDEARDAADSALTAAGKLSNRLLQQVRGKQRLQKQTVHPADGNGTVQFYLCPNSLTMYVGEPAVLVPIPYDAGNNILNEVPVVWTSNNTAVATVTNVGEVDAIGPGQATITASAGEAVATVSVTVQSGGRPIITDDQWIAQYGGDCSNPIQSRLQNTPSATPNGSASSTTAKAKASNGSGNSQPPVNPRTARPSFSDTILGPGNITPSPNVLFTKTGLPGTPAAVQTNPILEGGTQTDNGPISIAQVTSVLNAIGLPRLKANSKAKGGSSKINHKLASSDYTFAAPVISMPGRGIGMNLNLVYNSQVWSQAAPNGPVSYDLNKGWPAPGWSFGFGRLIPNFDTDNPALGDGQGTGSGDYPGDFLLVQPDGTQIVLSGVWNQSGGQTGSGAWQYLSQDGSYIQLVYTARTLLYPDGTVVKFNLGQTNNKWLPISITNPNGDVITIGYRSPIPTTPSGAPFVKTAINSITDSLGRVFLCNYYGDSGFPSDNTAHPAGALASVTCLDQFGGTRTLVQLDYTPVTLNYTFTNGKDSSVPAKGSQVWEVNSISYPATGTGYVMGNSSNVSSYNGYGIAGEISVRNNMSVSVTGGSSNYGNEIASTVYNYLTTGSLSQIPQFNQRTETWSGTSPSGSPISTQGVYTYSTSKTSSTITTTETYPDGTAVATTSDTSTSPGSDPGAGNVTGVVVTDGATGNNLSTTNYLYNYDQGMGTILQPQIFPQVQQVSASTDGGPFAVTTFSYGNFGRVSTVTEQGFTGSAVRTTNYTYINNPAYQNIFQRPTLVRLDLLSKVIITDNVRGLSIAETDFAYDQTALSSYSSTPPGYDTTYNGLTARGNITTTTQHVAVGDGGIPRTAAYDIFGNAVNVQVSCCNQKVFAFSNATQYSQPDSETDGPAGGPNLETQFTYNPNTSELATSIDVDNNQTGYKYDSDWRLSEVDYPTGAKRFITYASNQLSVTDQMTYTDNDNMTKFPTTVTVLDGARHVLATGNGSPTAGSYDAVAISYDDLGRVLTQSNPYTTTDGSHLTTSSSLSTSSYKRDGLARVTQVTLPDGNLVKTAYGAAGLANTLTVTDQVNRQKVMLYDGLGRLSGVDEENLTTGTIDGSNNTSYSYDALNNLLTVTKNGQFRNFAYDGLSRVTSVTTPETGTSRYTYYTSNQVETRTDNRNITTTYIYDGLNRLTNVNYPSQLPPGVAPTSNVTITYNIATPGHGNGQVRTVTDGAGSEAYQYDGFGRMASKTRAVDSSNSYSTGYTYNTVNQLSTIQYPSLKIFRNDFDPRGRVIGEDKVTSTGSMLTAYIQSQGSSYNAAQQITQLILGSGTVETYGYNNRLQLTQQTAVNSADTGNPTLMSLTYNYTATPGASGPGSLGGNSGQLMAIASGSKINNQPRDEAFTYDPVGQLATATGWGTWGRKYTADDYGNRLQTIDTQNGNAVLQNLTYNTQSGSSPSAVNNQVAHDTQNNITYGYDTSGNMTSDGAHTYAYDAEGRLAIVDQGTTNEFDYSYDVNNWRVKKVPGLANTRGATTYYVWNMGKVIAEYSNAAPTATSGVVYYHPDQLSTRLITDGSGSVVGTEDVMPFGEDPGSPPLGTSLAGINDERRFTSYERDPETVQGAAGSGSQTGTDYAVNRQYGNRLGRFMQPDSNGGSAANPQSLNAYSYSLGDPINLSDPSGLTPAWASSYWDPYSWITDASVEGPGIYIDGSPILAGEEGLAASAISSGTAVFGSQYTSYNTGGFYRNGIYVLSDTDVLDSSLADLAGGSTGPVPALAVSFAGGDSPNPCGLPMDDSDDIRAIFKVFRDTVTRLTAQGLRSASTSFISPYINNIESWWSSRLGCADQAKAVIDSLFAAQQKGLISGGWNFETQMLPLGLHVWGKASTSDPQEPDVIFDPWRDSIECDYSKFRHR